MIVLVKYQLNKPTKDYTALYRALGNLGQSVRDDMLNTAWYVYTALGVQGVYDALAPHIDANDRLFVTQLRRGEYNGWLKRDLWPWIEARL